MKPPRTPCRQRQLYRFRPADGNVRPAALHGAGAAITRRERIEQRGDRREATLGDPHTLRALVEELRRRILGDEELQRRLRSVTTAAGSAEVAAAAGVPLNPAQLVRDLARRLLGSDAELSVRNFDNCGWDQGELAWVNKTWP